MSESAVRVLATFKAERFSVRLADYQLGLKQSWHSHTEPILTLLLAGHTREQVGRADVIAGPLQVGIKPAEIRHTDHFWPNGVRALRVAFGPSFLAEVHGLSHVMESWRWMAGSQAVGPLLRVATLFRHCQPDYSELEEDLYEAVGALLSGPPAKNTADAPSWLCQARDHLKTAWPRGIRLTWIAREAKVHPVYFARQFRRFFGCSVGDYIRQQQTTAAAHLLGTPGIGLSDVACATGFSDQSHMTRVLSRSLGMTPAQFRRLVI